MILELIIVKFVVGAPIYIYHNPMYCTWGFLFPLVKKVMGT